MRDIRTEGKQEFINLLYKEIEKEIIKILEEEEGRRFTRKTHEKMHYRLMEYNNRRGYGYRELIKAVSIINYCYDKKNNRWCLIVKAHDLNLDYIDIDIRGFQSADFGSIPPGKKSVYVNTEVVEYFLEEVRKELMKAVEKREKWRNRIKKNGDKIR